jgi:chromosome segregation ATPase
MTKDMHNLYFDAWKVAKKECDELRRQLAEKDARIAELEAEGETLNRYCTKVDREKNNRIAELEKQIEDIQADAKWHVGR